MVNNSVEALQAGGVNFTSIRIPADFARARCSPDQTNDLMTTFSQVAGHSRPNHPI
jgi:hypothetical protein